MCCSLQMHAIVISSICLLFTLFTSGYFAKEIIFFISHTNGLVAGLGVFILISNLFAITSQILSIVGSSKNNKCLLIPFIISLILRLLEYIVVGIYMAYILIEQANYNVNPRTVFLPLSIGFGITTYFLRVIVKFYDALSSRSSLQPAMLLKPYTGNAGGKHSTARATTRSQTHYLDMGVYVT